MTIFNESPWVFFSYRFEDKDGEHGWGHCQILFTKPVTMTEIEKAEEMLTDSSSYKWVQILFWRRLEEENDPIQSE